MNLSKNYAGVTIRSIFKYFTYSFCTVLFLFSVSCKDSSGCPNCDLTPDPRPCEAAIQKFYFDKGENVCKVFIWGGCDGVIPFETLEECEACACI